MFLFVSAVQTINVTINVGPVAPNVTLDPNANSVLGNSVSQSNLSGQPNLNLNQSIATSTSSVLTSTASFSLPAPGVVNADVNANVSHNFLLANSGLDVINRNLRD